MVAAVVQPWAVDWKCRPADVFAAVPTLVVARANRSDRLIHGKRAGREGELANHRGVAALVKPGAFVRRTAKDGDIILEIRREQAALWVAEDLGIELRRAALP